MSETSQPDPIPEQPKTSLYGPPVITLSKPFESGPETLEFKKLLEDARWNEVLRLLGRITVAFNMLEASLRTMLAVLVSPQDEMLGLALAADMNFLLLIETCRKVSDSRAGNLPRDRADRDPMVVRFFGTLWETLDQADQLRRERNRLLHSQWFQVRDAPHPAISYRTSARGDEGLKIQTSNYDESDLSAVATRIESCGFKLMDLARQFPALSARES
ncbi:MAG: hypothetical protein JO251_08365 [Verrucomicrobia bacterium]|nr:hypothetical protein [Verrucomicrobiota bacterium]